MAAQENNQISQKPERGDLLVAKPWLTEPVFSRSVILLIDVDEDGTDKGSMGLVLNKKVDTMTMEDLIPSWTSGKDVPLFLGGPVDFERLFILHKFGDYFGKTVKIAPDLFIGADLEKVKKFIDQGGDIEGKLRFFLGYAGWTVGQLEEEIKSEAWEVTSKLSHNDILLGEGYEYWRREVEDLGEDHRHWLLIPEDPSLN